jgi:hypothetical protein
VEYLECKTIIVCASRSVERRQLVETENPSACVQWWTVIGVKER